MITRQFILKMHKDYGEAGLEPAWIRGAEPLNGLVCAHDMLEHQRREPGAAEGEIMALASGYIYRGQTIGYGGNSSAEENISSSFTEIFTAILYHGQRLSNPGRTHRLDDDIERSFEHIVDGALALWRREYRSTTGNDDEDPFHFFSFPTCEIRRRILGWMRRGIRAARRRYRGVNPYEVASLFTAIEQASDRFIKEFADYAEGEPRVTISACLATGRVYHRFDDPELRYLQ